jgi:hypothetical protein
MASTRFTALLLTFAVLGITAGAIFLGTGISIPYSSSNAPESTATRTTVVIQTVNVTQSHTTTVPDTIFTTVTLTTTSTLTNYTGTTQTFNSTDVTTDLSNSSTTVTVVHSVTTSINYTSITIQTDVITKQQHRR